MSAPSITAIILTFNEEIHLARCLSSAARIARRVVVVDSFSTDRTLDIARDHGAEVLQHAFTNQAAQFQWALDTLAIDTGWILKLDADEYLEPALEDEISARLPSLEPAVTGVTFRRKVIFRGRWIRFGGVYPAIFLRLWRAGCARVEQRWMDEHVVLTKGGAITFRGDFVDHNLNDITWWTDKHNGYATRQMLDFINVEFGLFPADPGMQRAPASQARIKRFIRKSLFGKAPLFLRGALYFLARYVFMLGFLDGKQGFIFHFLQGWWNWVLIDAKIDEARSMIRRDGLEAFRSHVAARYGYRLEQASQATGGRNAAG